MGGYFFIVVISVIKVIIYIMVVFLLASLHCWKTFYRKLLTFLSFGCIITIEKGKTLNGYAEGLLKNNPTFGQWGLFFYCYNKCNQRDNIHHYVHIFHNSHLLSRPLINVIRDIGCGITAQFHLHISRKCHCF